MHEHHCRWHRSHQCEVQDAGTLRVPNPIIEMARTVPAVTYLHPWKPEGCRDADQKGEMLPLCLAAIPKISPAQIAPLSHKRDVELQFVSRPS